MRLLENRSGQALALFAISLLLVAAITFFTIATGVRLQQKVKTQAAADSAAYGLAVSQARAMNVMALANRAIIGEYVSSLSVMGHISWMSAYEWTFDEQARLWQILKGDKQRMCALYQACLPGSPDRGTAACNPPQVCCKGPSGGCCTSQCHNWECYKAACSAPDALFDTLSQDWHAGFGNRSWEGIHSKWHKYPRPRIKMLGQYAADYVNQAWLASEQGISAYRQYRQMIEGQSYADGLATTIDRRMTAAKHATGVASSIPSDRLTANEQNIFDAIEIFPKQDGVQKIHDADFDVFNEILTGTRGGGSKINQDADHMVWETQHGRADGYFDINAGKEPGICQSYDHSSWPRYECSSMWDETMNGHVFWNEFGGTEPRVVADRYKGGAMMLQSGAGEYGSIFDTNTQNLHSYGSGDLGGQRALSAYDRPMTGATFDIANISCVPSWNVNSLVCLAETGDRGIGISEVAPKGRFACLRIRVDRGGNDSLNMGIKYDNNDQSSSDPDDRGAEFGDCGTSDTEVGFFRFRIDDLEDTRPVLNAKDPSAAVKLFNQPFTYASTQMDATVNEQNRPLPWSLSVGHVGGSALELEQRKDESGDARDNNDRRDGTRFTGGAEGFTNESYKHVRGFSAGLTYYHNPGSWAEVPNLFNPFWRAKLAPPGAYALRGLDVISPDDCQVGKELGYVNAKDDARCAR